MYSVIVQLKTNTKLSIGTITKRECVYKISRVLCCICLFDVVYGVSISPKNNNNMYSRFVI